MGDLMSTTGAHPAKGKRVGHHGSARSPPAAALFKYRARAAISRRAGWIRSGAGAILWPGRTEVYLPFRSTVPGLMADRASKRDFLSIPDFTREELEAVLELAASMKSGT